MVPQNGRSQTTDQLQESERVLDDPSGVDLSRLDATRPDATRPDATPPDATPTDRPGADPTSRRELNGQAGDALRMMLLAGESYRQSVANYYGVGITDTIAISYMSVHGDLGQTELARLLGRTTSSVTTMVDRLESAGFAVRAPHPADRRRTTIKLTARGMQVTRASDDWLAVTIEGLAPEEFPQLLQLLEKVVTGLRRSRDAIPSVRQASPSAP